MNNIVILGAGVMGSALSVPAASHSTNSITLVGSPLDNHIIDSLKETRHHPTLNAPLPASVRLQRDDEVKDSTLRTADVIVLGVSSPGIDWAVSRLSAGQTKPKVLALVTKGLVAPKTPTLPPLTYADSLADTLTEPSGQIVGIGGPCIARELSLGVPTRVTFAADNIDVANSLRDALQTDYYRITTTRDIVGLEACAALKNFLAIGVSAMMSTYATESGYAKNPVAALYNQAVRELFVLSQWLTEASRRPGESQEKSLHKTTPQALNPLHTAAFDLAGMGDLHVTVGGGRNSKLGLHLGEQQPLSSILAGPMHGVTVEGVDTGRRLAPGLRAACMYGTLNANELPLTQALLNTIENDALFNVDFTSLPNYLAVDKSIVSRHLALFIDTLLINFG